MAEFHKNSKLVKGINSSFITLVSKKENPVGLADYRPISLVSSLYKILTKVLSSRLKAVIPQIISENQSAFIGGRNILNGVLVANEVVDSWKKAKKRGLIIKLDFEKAYDSLNWDFLLSMKLNFGFSEKWVKWIKECIISARLSVHVNGAPNDEFSPQRGLRQGDALSSFLFSIAAKGLTDVLEVRNVKRILRCFELLSGLKINYHKSLVSRVGVPVEVMNEIASVLSCKVKSMPFQYLGLLLGVNPSRKASWRPMLDKARSKLAGCKRKLLSFAGRLTLIKYVLSSLPIYYLSLYKLPQGVGRELDKIQASFLWEGLI
ncbi:uncharacterized protein LOC114257077 [Camellia sinensis]|uniref:uncharacterized protein LOC114257077 n=1 Tax=Camellia sinensis TaxID=4442 RepID=UPI001035927E|nr:uncharacterized protein LOC114257077 [Camellia sinensis]